MDLTTKSVAEPPAPSPADLLCYEPSYRVLICTSCRYAIQPHALSRHLKEIHHIYRAYRRPYIAYASKFELSEADDVRSPERADFPIRHLLVELGWKCKAAQCPYLCVSTKRMQAHWSAEHGRKADPDTDWKRVRLQTFFRGNLLRYFSDAGPDTDDDAAGLSSSSVAAVKGLQRDATADQHQRLLTSALVGKLEAKYELDSADCAIIRHFFQTTFRTFASNAETEYIWMNVIPALAYDHAFLLYGLLACASLHRAFIDPSQHDFFALRACTHQEIALPLYRQAIEYPTTKNCDAITSFSFLLVVYAFASDRDKSHAPLLLANESTVHDKQEVLVPQWLHFIRAGCSMLCDLWDAIDQGPVSALADVWEVELRDTRAKEPYLDHFIGLIPKDSEWSAQDVSTYRHEASNLAGAFVYVDETLETSKEINTWTLVGAWPLGIGDAYIDMLHRRHSGALILLAYYCIILKRLDTCWFSHGRAVKLMRLILEVLNKDERAVIQPAVDAVVEDSTADI